MPTSSPSIIRSPPAPESSNRRPPSSPSSLPSYPGERRTPVHPRCRRWHLLLALMSGEEEPRGRATRTPSTARPPGMAPQSKGRSILKQSRDADGLRLRGCHPRLAGRSAPRRRRPHHHLRLHHRLHQAAGDLVLLSSLQARPLDRQRRPSRHGTTRSSLAPSQR